MDKRREWEWEWGGEGGALSNCALTGSEGLVRPEAVRAAGETGSDIKVTEERLGIKMPPWSKRLQRRARP